MRTRFQTLNATFFERLVESLYRVVDADATVTWDETIDGWQFDVTVRFRKGLHDYLTLIECKDLSRNIAGEAVNAFASKSDAVHADKAVIVTTVGFQPLALKSAERNGVVLLTLTEEEFIHPMLLEERVALHMHDVLLFDSHGAQIGFASGRDPASARLLRDSVLTDGDTRMELWEFLSRHIHAGAVEDLRDAERRYLFTTPPGSWLEPPYGGPRIELVAIQVSARLATAQFIKEKFTADSVLRRTLVLRDADGREVFSYPAVYLRLSLDEVVEPGVCYYDFVTGEDLYCEITDGVRATMYLVNSRQAGGRLSMVIPGYPVVGHSLCRITSPEKVEQIVSTVEKLKATLGNEPVDHASEE